MGGKVQAPPGYADHVRFIYPDFCERCVSKMCIEMCSGQAITAGPGGVPAFDREKCIHCGACIWNCAAPLEDDPLRSNIFPPRRRPAAGFKRELTKAPDPSGASRLPLRFRVNPMIQFGRNTPMRGLFVWQKRLTLQPPCC